MSTPLCCDLCKIQSGMVRFGCTCGWNAHNEDGSDKGTRCKDCPNFVKWLLNNLSLSGLRDADFEDKEDIMSCKSAKEVWVVIKASEPVRVFLADLLMKTLKDKYDSNAKQASTSSIQAYLQSQKATPQVSQGATDTVETSKYDLYPEEALKRYRPSMNIEKARSHFKTYQTQRYGAITGLVIWAESWNPPPGVYRLASSEYVQVSKEHTDEDGQFQEHVRAMNNEMPKSALPILPKNMLNAGGTQQQPMLALGDSPRIIVRHLSGQKLDTACRAHNVLEQVEGILDINQLAAPEVRKLGQTLRKRGSAKEPPADETKIKVALESLFDFQAYLGKLTTQDCPTSSFRAKLAAVQQAVELKSPLFESIYLAAVSKIEKEALAVAKKHGGSRMQTLVLYLDASECIVPEAPKAAEHQKDSSGSSEASEAVQAIKDIHVILANSLGKVASLAFKSSLFSGQASKQLAKHMLERKLLRPVFHETDVLALKIVAQVDLDKASTQDIVLLKARKSPICKALVARKDDLGMTEAETEMANDEVLKLKEELARGAVDFAEQVGSDIAAFDPQQLAELAKLLKRCKACAADLTGELADSHSQVEQQVEAASKVLLEKRMEALRDVHRRILDNEVSEDQALAGLEKADESIYPAEIKDWGIMDEIKKTDQYSQQLSRIARLPTLMQKNDYESLRDIGHICEAAPEPPANYSNKANVISNALNLVRTSLDIKRTAECHELMKYTKLAESTSQGSTAILEEAKRCVDGHFDKMASTIDGNVNESYWEAEMAVAADKPIFTLSVKAFCYCSVLNLVPSLNSWKMLPDFEVVMKLFGQDQDVNGSKGKGNEGGKGKGKRKTEGRGGAKKSRRGRGSTGKEKEEADVEPESHAAEPSSASAGVRKRLPMEVMDDMGVYLYMMREMVEARENINRAVVDSAGKLNSLKKEAVVATVDVDIGSELQGAAKQLYAELPDACLLQGVLRTWVEETGTKFADKLQGFKATLRQKLKEGTDVIKKALEQYNTDRGTKEVAEAASALALSLSTPPSNVFGQMVEFDKGFYRKLDEFKVAFKLIHVDSDRPTSPEPPTVSDWDMRPYLAASVPMAAWLAGSSRDGDVAKKIASQVGKGNMKKMSTLPVTSQLVADFQDASQQ
mmetsp:Transcript_104170/g.185019  ORF Transcript_104170/g.185019 Transcript_104170/m.185019 type:complete len:1139 (+) Transcript_104170:43-3459(+)